MKKATDIFMKVVITIMVAVLCVVCLAFLIDINEQMRLIYDVVFGLLFMEITWSVWKMGL